MDASHLLPPHLALTRPITMDVTALLARLQTVPDGCKRRSIRYPLAVLLSIAVLAKVRGDSHVHALADRAHARARSLPDSLGLSACACRTNLNPRSRACCCRSCACRGYTTTAPCHTNGRGCPTSKCPTRWQTLARDTSVWSNTQCACGDGVSCQ